MGDLSERLFWVRDKESRPVLKIGLVLAGLIAFTFDTANAAEIVFASGSRMRDVRIVSRTAESLTVESKYGVVSFPLASIVSIDGQPVREPGKPSPSPVPSPAAALPMATPVPAEPAPEPVKEPVVVEPKDAAAPESIPGVAAPAERPLQLNFEFVLLGLLVGGAVWMRSVFAVQRDLYERHSEPRFWTMAALLLPGIGAAAYFAFARVRDMTARTTETQGIAGGAASPAEAANPWKKLPPVDPAMFLKKKGQTREGLTFLDTERQSIALKDDEELASGLDTATELLEEALLESASDVHIEPTGAAYRVRFRLDGILHERMSYNTTDGRRLVTSLKSLAEIDIAEKRKAQDGHFRVSSSGREVDFRVATTNSLYGEKMVIRVLDHRSGIFDLTALGMSDEMLATFQRVIHSRSGMILATGPTGSGKTSTLYAAVRQLDTTSLNIMTIEDPAEYELASITQIAVNPKAGITYESGLRSILRQDPDVILVGEMRDSEAAEIAMRAALTGHLVLSSLHTKDAIGTISRLQDMKIERYQAASALLMVLAQRLVRVLCQQCRKPYECEGNELESIGLSLEPGSILYLPNGCDACRGTGFKGRTGIFELLVLDDDLRKAVGEGVDESNLTDMAMERGFKGYRYDGAEKVLLGITTVEEVLQAG